MLSTKQVRLALSVFQHGAGLLLVVRLIMNKPGGRGIVQDWHAKC